MNRIILICNCPHKDEMPEVCVLVTLTKRDFLKCLIAIKMCISINRTASWTFCVCRPYRWYLLCYCPRSALPLGLIMEKRGGPFILLGPQRSRHRNYSLAVFPILLLCPRQCVFISRWFMNASTQTHTRRKRIFCVSLTLQECIN